MIDLGDVVSLAVDITDANGDAANAGAVAVTITKPDGDSDNVTPSNPAPGRYQISYTPTLPGHHQVRWVATGANAAAFTDSFTVSSPSALLSLTEARVFLNLTSHSDDEELREFVQIATAAASEYCKVDFELATHVEAHDIAPGQSTIILRNPRAISISSVQAFGEALAADEYQLNSTGELVRRVSGASSAAFPAGLGAVTIEYSSGLAATKLTIARHAVREMLRHLWKTQRGSKGAGLPLADEWQSASGYTFPHRVTELLEPLRRIA